MSNYKNTYDLSKLDHSWIRALELIKPKGSVLEVGCGNGNFAEVMTQEKACVVDAIEPDAGDARLAEKKVKTLIVDTVENSIDKLKQRSYDQIVFLDVIEHLNDPVDCLKKIRTLLKPDGEVVFSLPNMAHTSVRLMLMTGNFTYGKTGLLDATHLHFYTKKEILRIFREAGYVISFLGRTEIEYTEDIIKEQFASQGVKNVDHQLISMLTNNEGSTYQFIGVAKKARTTQQDTLPSVSPSADGIVRRHYEKKIAELSDELAAIKQSKSFRAAKLSGKFINKINRTKQERLSNGQDK